MSFFISFLRNLVGGILVLIDLVTRGGKLKRTPQAQQQVDEAAQKLALYQFFACPFCIKTRRAIYKLNVPIASYSASKGSPHRDELLAGGGKIQTPCLRIESEGETSWLYESSQIIAYLNERFAQDKDLGAKMS